MSVKQKYATLRHAPMDKQKLVHFINFTNAEVVVNKVALRGANQFNIVIKCLGKSFRVIGNYIDVSETKTTQHYKEQFLSLNSNSTLDELFSFYDGPVKKKEYFNRDTLNSIEAKLKLII